MATTPAPFEVVHPRDPGGKFTVKPGHEAPGGTDELGAEPDDVSDLQRGARLVEAAFADAGIPIHRVGGCVRDPMLGIEPKDIDFASPALPDETADLLDGLGSLYEVGRDHGTVAVNIGGCDYEVTTFRTETYPDASSRQPEVSFTDDLDVDLARRDFTINAMAQTPDGGVHDPFGGRRDIETGVIRCVGDPDDRFAEDPLRVVRAVRFASLHDFDIDPDTSAAMRRHADDLAGVSVERVQAEVDRVVSSDDPQALQRMAHQVRSHGLDQAMFGARLSDSTQWSKLVSRDARLAGLHRSGVDLAAAKWPRSDVDQARRVHRLAETFHEDTGGNAMTVRHTDDATLSSVEQMYASTGRPVPARFDQETMDRLRAPLPVNGHDALSMGLKGPAVGEALKRAERTYVEERGEPDRDELLRVMGEATKD